MSADRPATRRSGPTEPPRPRSDITVTLRCNNQCRFCPRPTLRHIRVRSLDDLDERLRAIREHSRRVVLTGGEVTLLSDFVELVAKCRAARFEQIGIITNARQLADRSLTRRAVEAGLSEACVTVYDLRDEVHDGLTTQPGSLAETLQGLDNLLAEARRSEGLLVRVNTLLCAANADGLHDTLRELARRGVERFLIGDVMLSEGYPAALPHGSVIDVMASIAGDAELATVPIVWRGFPLCLARAVPSIVIEPHDIDTAVVDPSDLDAYFAEFAEMFEKQEVCAECERADACLGVQRRYVAAHGAGHLAPLPAEESEQALAEARRELAGFPPWPESGRLEVMPTAACPFRCTYCRVELGERQAASEVLDRAVDLLLSSRREQVELQFFGGEPLLRRGEMMRTMSRGAELAAKRNKQLRFVITTSGLLLDDELLAFLRHHDVKVMISVDGPRDVMLRYRPLARSGRDVTERLEHNLRRLIRSGIDYFVNMVVTPEDAGEIPARLGYLAGLGVQTIQICYALGLGWTPQAQDRFCDSLRRCAEVLAEPTGPQVRLQNLGSAAEPTVLSTDMIVDVDGTVYSDAALFAERVFPGLRPAFRLGSVFEIVSFDGLRRTREQNLLALRRAYPDRSSSPRRVLEEQLEFARRIQRTLDELGTPRASAPDDNPLQRTVLRRELAHQARVMRRRPELLPLPILMLENECYHDCLFCLSKPLEPTPLDGALRWLAANRRLGLERLGLAGNEPLAHPEIDRIVAEARRVGFTRLDVLTSAVPLADWSRARDLVSAGVTGYAVPLYAAEAALHDGITQSPGSHAATVQGIENLLELGADVFVHANLLQRNLDNLQALQSLVRHGWGRPLCIIPIRPKAANRPYAELAPRYDDIAARAKVDCLVGFPLCVAAKVQDPALPSGSIISDVLKLYVLDQPFVKPAKCRACRWQERCSGTFQAYLDLHGDEELEPYH